MTGEVRPIAMGVGKIKFGTVGDGVPGADLKDFPLPTKGSVVFNFADPKEVICCIFYKFNIQRFIASFRFDFYFDTRCHCQFCQ